MKGHFLSSPGDTATKLAFRLRAGRFDRPLALFELRYNLVTEDPYGVRHNIAGNRRCPVGLEHDLIGAVLLPEHFDLFDHIFRSPKQVNLRGRVRAGGAGVGTSDADSSVK